MSYFGPLDKATMDTFTDSDMMVLPLQGATAGRRDGRSSFGARQSRSPFGPISHSNRTEGYEVANLTPQQVGEKWRKNTAAATDSYKQGVQAVTVAPGELAARAADRMLDRITASVTSGRYQAAARAVPLSDWQNAAVNKGATRLAQGAAAGQPKMTQFLTEFLPVMQQVKEQVRNMPKGTTEDALARIRVNIEAGKRFAGRQS